MEWNMGRAAISMEWKTCRVRGEGMERRGGSREGGRG